MANTVRKQIVYEGSYRVDKGQNENFHDDFSARWQRS